MKTAFADTSFYIALVNPRDEWNAAARRVATQWDGRILTTEYVLVEIGNRLARSGDRTTFLRLADKIENDARTEIVWAGEVLYRCGLDLYSRRADKDWSLTDCVSFIVMEERGLTEALTGDRHFEQAAFKILLK